MSIKIADEAQASIEAAFAEYVVLDLEKGSTLALQFDAQKDRTLALVEAQPRAYAVLYEDVRRVNLVWHWMAFYRVTGDDVLVLDVLPDQADPARWP